MIKRSTCTTTTGKVVCPIHIDLEYSVKMRTGKMRFSPTENWKRIRDLLAEKQIAPKICILAQFYTNGPSSLAGVLILPDRSVIEWVFEVSEDDVASGEFRLWRVINSDAREYRRWEKEIELGLSLIE